MKHHLITSLVLVCVASAASAGPILIDFNKTSEVPYQDGSGAWWNAFDDTPAAQPPQDLIDTINAATGATISNPAGMDAKDVVNPYVGPETWLINNPTAVARGSLIAAGTAVTYTISGLAGPGAGESYAIDFYTSWSNTDGETVSINGASQWIDTNDNYAANPQTVLKWTGVALDGNGDIVMTLTPDAGERVFANAMKIELVPEPATLSLLVIGGIAMIRRRR